MCESAWQEGAFGEERARMESFLCKSRCRRFESCRGHFRLLFGHELAAHYVICTIVADQTHLSPDAVAGYPAIPFLHDHDQQHQGRSQSPLPSPAASAWPHLASAAALPPPHRQLTQDRTARRRPNRQLVRRPPRQPASPILLSIWEATRTPAGGRRCLAPFTPRCPTRAANPNAVRP